MTAKGEPGQSNAVSHGCPVARFRDQGGAHARNLKIIALDREESASLVR